MQPGGYAQIAALKTQVENLKAVVLYWVLLLLLLRWVIANNLGLGLNIKQEVHTVTILNNIFFAFYP